MAHAADSVPPNANADGEPSVGIDMQYPLMMMFVSPIAISSAVRCWFDSTCDEGECEDQQGNDLQVKVWPFRSGNRVLWAMLSVASMALFIMWVGPLKKQTSSSISFARVSHTFLPMQYSYGHSRHDMTNVKNFKNMRKI